MMTGTLIRARMSPPFRTLMPMGAPVAQMMMGFITM
jgi:hypothetical protein